MALFLILSCNSSITQNIQFYQWEFKETIRSKVLKPTKLLQSWAIYGDKICFSNQFERRVFLYDLKNQELKANILLDDFLPKKIARKTVLYYHFWDTDSLLLVFNGADHPYYYHDSLIVTINLDNQQIRYHNIEKIPVISSYRPEKIGNNYWFPFGLKYLVKNNQLLLPLIFYSGEWGDTSFVQAKPPVAGILNLSNSEFHLLPISHPTKLGITYPREFNQIFANFEKDVVIGWAHNSKLCLYDVKNQKVKTFDIPSIFVKEINHLPDFVDYKQRPNVDKSLGKFLDIHFHTGLNLYYRLVRVPAPEFASEIDKKNFPSYSIQFFNLEKNYYAETLIPDSLASNYWDLIPYKNGFLVPSKHSQTIDFDYYELIPKKISKIDLVNKFEQKYRNQKRETGFINYLKIVHNFSGLDGNYLIIPTMKSCPPCADALMKLLCENKKYWLKSDLKVIIIGTLHRFDELFKKINCNSEGFWLDKEEIFWEYEPEFTNFKFITIENEKIIDERILNPGDLNIIQKLIESLKIVNSK